MRVGGLLTFLGALVLQELLLPVPRPYGNLRVHRHRRSDQSSCTRTDCVGGGRACVDAAGSSARSALVEPASPTPVRQLRLLLFRHPLARIATMFDEGGLRGWLGGLQYAIDGNRHSKSSLSLANHSKPTVRRTAYWNVTALTPDTLVLRYDLVP
jgi:hypothetical protein